MPGVRVSSLALIFSLLATCAAAQTAPAPLLPPSMTPAPPPPVPQPASPAVLPPVATPLAASWRLPDAQGLLAAIEAAAADGLAPADYEPETLKAAISAGEGAALDLIATRAFSRLAADMRDGRTPSSARVEWYVRDSDSRDFPTETLLAAALASHDIAATLAGVAPAHPDYAALKAELAATPPSDLAKIALLRTNLERWRWLPRELGTRHVLVNVPEYMLRVVSKGKLVSAFRVVVGKPDRATPQLAEMAQGVIFNPTWTVPQSIIAEGIGNTIRTNPAAARARGYTWTANGNRLSVVQQPGPGNSLGQMKIDMPNAHAIFVHDTPSKSLFSRPARAFSHGCIRADRAAELGFLLAILQAGIDPKEGADAIRSRKTQRVAFTTPLPIYVGYFTAAPGADGKIIRFADLYGRDTPVIASLARARVETPVAPPPLAPETIDDAEDKL